MKKICVTSKTLGRGGSETLLKTILPKLKLYGYDITIAYFLKTDFEYTEYFESQGIEVVYIGSLSFSDVFNTSVRYFKFLKSNKFDVIFDNSPLPSIFSRLFCTKEKIVYIEHCMLSNLNIVTRLLNKFTYRFCDEIICCSEEVFTSNGKKGMVVQNCVDLEWLQSSLSKFNLRERLNLQPDSKIIVNVANTSAVKNQKMLVDAYKHININNVIILIVGLKKDAYDELSSYIEKNKLSGKVLFYGSSNNIPTILNESNIFTLSSKNEGLPISLLEAMALGLVPVCTNVGGMKTLINDTVGIKVELDSPKEMAKAYDKLLSDHVLYSKLSLNCKELIKKEYDVDAYCEIINDVFTKKNTK